MIRSPRAGLVTLALIALLAACTDEPAGDPPTTTASIATTTTTPASAAIDIPEQGLVKLQPGTTYVAGDFWEPVSLSVEEEGWWWARGATDLWVHLEYHEGGESTWDLDVSVIAPDPDRPPEDLASDILGDESLTVTADPQPVTVARHDGLVFDVAAPDRDDIQGGPDSCVDPEYLGNSRFFQLHSGAHILRDSVGDAVVGGWSFGVRECRAARIWVIDVEGSTIVIIAATISEDVFDRLIPAAEHLLADLEFG